MLDSSFLPSFSVVISQTPTSLLVILSCGIAAIDDSECFSLTPPSFKNSFKISSCAICTISDSLVTGEETTPEERQTAFTTMMKVALDTAVAMENK